MAPTPKRSVPTPAVGTTVGTTAANTVRPLPQLYVEAGYGDLSVKAGHFYTIIGYEVVQATGNFFYSHAYTFNFSEPFTHTGVLAQYDASERLTFYGGYSLGIDSGGPLMVQYPGGAGNPPRRDSTVPVIMMGTGPL